MLCGRTGHLLCGQDELGTPLLCDFRRGGTGLSWRTSTRVRRSGSSSAASSGSAWTGRNGAARLYQVGTSASRVLSRSSALRLMGVSRASRWIRLDIAAP